MSIKARKESILSVGKGAPAEANVTSGLRVKYDMIQATNNIHLESYYL